VGLLPGAPQATITVAASIATIHSQGHLFSILSPNYQLVQSPALLV
jgi:hypothetical protein